MKNKIILAAVAIIAAAALFKGKYIMTWFTESEFGGWFSRLSVSLMKKLDVFRELVGFAVNVSPVSGAVGRNGGDSHSQHNVDRWGQVNAVDLFVELDGQPVTTQAQRKRLYELAKQAGFTGIGIYTDTFYRGQPWNMLHVDTRKVSNNEIATWSRVDGNYLSINEVIA